jgi:DNA polymerase V
MKKGSVSNGLVFHAGFPNAGEDQNGQYLSLDKSVFRHRLSTFLWKLDADILEMKWSRGSVVVVDRALAPRQGDFVVAVVEEDFVVRRYHQKCLYDFHGELETSEQVSVWGVITHVLQEYRTP